MTEEEIGIELMGGNVKLRNAIIIKHMDLIRSVVHTYALYSTDRLHDAIVYIAKRLPYYDGEKGALSSYMYKLALGGLWYGRIKSKREYDAPHVNIGKVKISGPLSPSEVIMNKEYKEVRREALNKAMANLSIPDQWAVRQHFLKGRTMTAIAREDGISPQGMRQKLQRILKRMGRDVEHYADDLR